MDQIPDGEVFAARRFLEYLCTDPVVRALDAAPWDDEPVTDADREAIRRGRAEIAQGNVRPLDDVIQELDPDFSW